jgi:hypothetical protein
VTFTRVTYAVTITESGLANGATWSVALSGGANQTAAGPSVVFYLANGTYTFTVSKVDGYSLSNATVTVLVKGSPAGASVSFTPNTSTSVVSTDTFNMWLTVAIALGVIALVIALLAMLFRRKKSGGASGAQPWTPPPAAAGGESGKWSEGPPSGGSPPSS